MADDKYSISAVISAVDKITGPVRRINRAVASMTGPARRVGGAFGSLYDVAGLKSFNKALGGVGRSVGRLGNQVKGMVSSLGLIGGLAAGGGIAKLTTSYADASDQIAKFSRQVGLSAEAYQELRFAADRAGVSQSVFDSSMVALNKRLGEAKAGTGGLYTLLKKVSPTLLEQVQAAGSTEEAFSLLTGAMEKIEDPSKRAALAAAAFSRSGVAMVNLMGGGNQEIDALRKEAQRLGLVISEESATKAESFVDSMTNMKASATGLANVIGGELLPHIQPLIDGLTGWIVANRELIAQKIGDIVKRFSEFIQSINWSAVGNGISDVFSAIGDVVDAIGGWENAAVALAVVMNGELIGGISSVVGHLGKLGGVLLANPILAAVAAIGAAIYVIYDNWDGIVSWFNEKIGNVVNAFKDGFLNGIMTYMREFHPFTLVFEAFDGLIEYLTGFSVSEYVMTKFNKLSDDLLSWSGDALGSVVRSFDEGFIGGIMDAIRDFNPFAIIYDAVDGLINYLTSFDLSAILMRKFHEAVSWMPDAMKKMLGIEDMPEPPAPVPVQRSGQSRIAGIMRGNQTTTRDARATVDVNFNGLPAGARVTSQTSGEGMSLETQRQYAFSRPM